MQFFLFFNFFNSIFNRFVFIAIFFSIYFVENAALATTTIKPMSYEDIITFAKPQWIELSSNGSKVAFCTRKGSLEKNCNIDTFYVLNIHDGQPKKMVEFDEILQAKWGNQNDAIYLLVKHDTTYKIICCKDDTIITLIESIEPIHLFSISPDDTHLCYTVSKSCSLDGLKQEEMEEGHVYELGKDNLTKLAQHNYHYNEREEIWCLDLLSGHNQFITFLNCSYFIGQYYPVITSLDISEDNKRLLLSYSKLGRVDLGGTPFESDVIVWDLVLNEWYDPLNDSIDIEETACWISDKKFVFQQTSYLTQSPVYSIWLFDANSHRGECLDWLKISQKINRFQWNQGVLYGISNRFLYQIFLEEKRVEQIEIPLSLSNNLSLDKEALHVGFISESIDHPPEIAIYDLNEKKATRLTTLNPQLENMALGKVEKIVLQTPSGYSATGFIIHPYEEKPGVRYPIIIGTYGFQGKFITDAEWHSSFPAQTLAGEGYLVLLLNAPGLSQGMVGDSIKARQVEGWNKLELFEQAVDFLVERGIGDPNKVGIYGWSHGAFIVNFLISHSQKFHVACLGEGGDYNPGGFWLGGNLLWPKIYECTFGGPPWGETLKNYLEFSPFFQVDKIRTPLLLEFAGFDACGFEMYTPLRYLGVPSELIFYDGEEHVFVRPKARLASMARKLDWFNYWFFDKRDLDPKKKKQYERWDKMRDESIKRGL